MRILKVAGGMSAAIAVLAMAVPAQAQDRRGGGRGQGRDHNGRDHGRHHRGGDKIDAGDVLLGAAILGVFALATSGKKSNRGNYVDNDAPYASDADQYDGVYDTESAGERCADAAENEAHNYAERSRFRSISSTSWNGRSWVVKGRVDLADGDDGNERTQKFRCALRAGSAPQVSFEGL